MFTCSLINRGIGGVRAKMEKRGFYVTLPSNASLQIYPYNKIWCFRTKLAKPINLNKSCEVGLIELQYLRVWNTFSAADADVIINGSKTQQPVFITLPVGFYDSIPRIQKECNSGLRLNTATARISLQYNNATNFVYFMGAEGTSFTFKGRLAEILSLSCL